MDSARLSGTLIEGTIHQGDEIAVYPEDKATKVRNLQVHNQSVDTAFAGQRTAVNLAGLKKEDIERGSVLAAKGSLEPTMMVDVKLEMFDDTERVAEYIVTKRGAGYYFGKIRSR